jgi:hypothetical protein
VDLSEIVESIINQLRDALPLIELDLAKHAQHTCGRCDLHWMCCLLLITSNGVMTWSVTRLRLGALIGWVSRMRVILVGIATIRSWIGHGGFAGET